MPLLQVENLKIAFSAAPDAPKVVDGVSFSVEPGEILSLVGESGCGKSISCMALTALLPAPPAVVTADSIRFEGRELTALPPREMRRIRGGGIGYIFQEPSVSLNPVFRVGDQIAEVLRLHRPEIRDRKREIIQLLGAVGIPAPESRISAYPHEMSGGMQQRVMIAMALAGNPKLLIADEPTTALDVTIQAQILELIDHLRKEKNMGVILITHNLGIVASLADNVAMMYAGRIVEYASAKELFAHPQHPYTRALLEAVPRLGNPVERLANIPGHVPTPEEFPAGCRFCGRCLLCGGKTAALQERCRLEKPELQGRDGHFTACHFTGGAQ
ncbi:MAG: ABC transporter ATP-binding protein [Lentisphaeria bacterium]|nr:ABC transporter ATP-binding protein [Lentisphaeria bacterium]